MVASGRLRRHGNTGKKKEKKGKTLTSVLMPSTEHLSNKDKEKKKKMEDCTMRSYSLGDFLNALKERRGHRHPVPSLAEYL